MIFLHCYHHDVFISNLLAYRMLKLHFTVSRRVFHRIVFVLVLQLILLEFITKLAHGFFHNFSGKGLLINANFIDPLQQIYLDDNR